MKSAYAVAALYNQSPVFANDEPMTRCAHIQSDVPVWQRSSEDELVNAATHAFGFLLAIVGALVMTSGVAAQGDRRLILGCGAYLVSLVAVYAMSTLSHGATSLRWKSLFRQLDQGFIYLLIVGTYTPFALAYLRGGLWWVLLAGMWTVALFGFATKLFYTHRDEAVSVTSYVVLGWMPIVTIPTLLQTAPMGVFWSIMAGGLCYCVGVVFLMFDERVRHFHAVWHICVIAGSACHFLGMFAFVVRGAI